MHAPLQASEMALLRQYAPDVPTSTLFTLVQVFDHLRAMVDDGATHCSADA
jgi:hypothetical protein